MYFGEIEIPFTGVKDNALQGSKLKVFFYFMFYRRIIILELSIPLLQHGLGYSTLIYLPEPCALIYYLEKSLRKKFFPKRCSLCLVFNFSRTVCKISSLCSYTIGKCSFISNSLFVVLVL